MKYRYAERKDTALILELQKYEMGNTCNRKDCRKIGTCILSVYKMGKMYSAFWYYKNRLAIFIKNTLTF